MAWLKELQGLGKLMEPWNNHLITAQAILMEDPDLVVDLRELNLATVINKT